MMRTIRTVPALPDRKKDAHKGDCGRVLIVGGCRGMAGAPCLAAQAAYRAGAGLVKVAVPESIWNIVAAKLDECTTTGLPETRHGAFSRQAAKNIQALAAEANVVVCGPGLSAAPDAPSVAREVVRDIERALVLDADGLNAFVGAHLNKLSAAQKRHGGRTLVLTPHPGEAARLLDTTTGRIQQDRRRAALELCRRAGPDAVVVLKGAGTIVADAKRIHVNTTGNPGMATGGTGDVLSGVIGALLGQGMNGFDAAVLGVYLHGLAGDLTAKRLGEWSLMAGDLLEDLPRAIVKHNHR